MPNDPEDFPDGTEPVDTDGDGVADDADNCPSVANPDQTNSDDDGMGDACDTDDDNDGTPDETDAFPLDPAEQSDADEDGVGNNADTDDDNDGMPDAWETQYGLNPLGDDASEDKDNDGLSNLKEYEQNTDPTDPDDPPPAPVDTDGDGVRDSKDAFPNDPAEWADSDKDGVGDNADAFPNDPNEQVDTDDDGTGNNADTDDDNDGMPDVWELEYGLNPLVNDASGDTDKDGYSNLEEYEAETDPTDADSKPESPFEAGVFKVGADGVVQIDWLYDGGAYKGELGIFSLRNMEDLEPGSEEFISEAVRRVLSDSEEGHLVLSDPSEGARFSGSLGEARNWNSGEYKGVKSFDMKPGDDFATILVPNGTFGALADNPGTTNTHLRPLFSLVSSNPVHGMYLGQIADVNGMGTAFSYEDISANDSDKDYNDLIIQITGAAIDGVPSLDSLTGGSRRSRAGRDRNDWFDWRAETELGGVIMEHLDAQITDPETLWLSADINTDAALLAYDPEGRVIGETGGHIPGATFGEDIDGYRFVSLPALEEGGYRLVILGEEDESGILTVRKHQGEDEVISEETMSLDIEAHQVLISDVDVASSGESLVIDVADAGESEAGPYDFNGDGIIDDSDIEKVSSVWNICEGDEGYVPFLDLDDDGCITILDIMPVVNSR
nr:DUF4114 domain-containing protein [Desulfonema magnum]